MVDLVNEATGQEVDGLTVGERSGPRLWSCSPSVKIHNPKVRKPA